MLWTKSFRYWMALTACSLLLAASGAAPLPAQEKSTAPAAAEGAPPEPADEAEATPADEGAPTAETPAADAPAAPAPETPAAEVPTEAAPTETSAPAATETPAAGSPAEATATESAETAPAGAAAPAAAAPEKKGMSTLVIFLIVVAVVVLPFWLGGLIAQNLRLPDYGWKIGLALSTIITGTVICYFGWPPRLGPDLSGGINLIYEVAPEVKDQNIDMDKLIGALSRRINPGGIKEVMIRPYGERQIEIIIPKADDAEIELVKRSLGTAGALEFRIVANREDHAQVIEAALASENRQVVIGGTTVARWVKLDPQQFDAASAAQQFITRPNPRGDFDVLVMMDDFNVTGEYLDSASPGIDQGGRPSVNFTFDARGENRFAELTTENAPVQGASFKRSLGIVLDNTLLSAPSLNEPITGGRGQISGGNFTKAEVDFLVSILNAGSLPAALTKEPISEQVTSPTLGGDTVRTGAWASGVSILAVMVFMAIYYRFSGLVACLALLVNLILLLAVMILIKAAFTLPGIAGLVLTVGMAVDANVLIYERIREEIARGAALRMAIRNGFDRATTTIVDANVTTLITAVVLYWIGTDQIKGFAITLILGILMSMYTAIFLARLVFDIADRKRWITSLSMMRMLGATQIDFVAKARGAIALALVVIVIGLVGVVIRGKTILDIDFTGGSSVTLAFADKQDITEVRHEVVEATRELRTEVEAAQARVQAATGEISDHDKALADTNLPIEFTVVGVGDDDRWFKVDTSIRDFGIAQEMLKKQFGERLVTNHMAFSELKTAGLLRATAPLAAEGHTLLLSATQPTAFLQDEATDAKPAETPKADQPAAEAPADDASKAETPKDEAQAAETPADEAPKAETPAAEPDLTIEDQPADEQKLLEEQKEAEAKGPKTSTTLTFGEPIKFATLEGLLQENFAANNLIEVPFTLKNVAHEAGSEVPQTSWDLTIDLPADQTQKLLGSLAAQIDAMTVFPSSSNIGGQVAGDTQLQAAYALIASLFFIAGYIWLRFQQFMFGLAAVVALVHDVIITVGCLALSKYLVDYASPVAAATLIDPFKISLPIVAALLTVIGYSLNDTIVVFDRIREIRGKSPELTPTMINTSINQTLSRTLLTSGTTLLVVVILYIWGGPGIHGFAFSLLVGVGVGTFSSIFIAAPLLLWMSQPSAAPAAKTPEKARA